MTNIKKALEELIKSLDTDPLVATNVQRVPGIISAHDDVAKFIRLPVEQSIFNIADLMYEQDINISKALSRREFRSIVRLVIAQSLPSLSGSTDNYKIKACQLKKRFKEKIKDYTSVHGDLKAIYGCWLITPPPNKLIEIGPVRFEDRSSWLERTRESKLISKITYSRLSREFTGKRIKQRKPSTDQQNEEIIRHQISNSPMICEVLIQGLGVELAYKRSMIAVNLALTSIALIGETPSSILKRFQTTLDDDPKSTYNCLIDPNNQEVVNVRRNKRLSMLEILPDTWEAYYDNAGCFLKIAGEMIKCWVNASYHAEASPLLRSLSQSLFFFWKACNESSDLLSIIEFVTVLETLVKGRKKEGILNLLDARLNLSRDQEFFKNENLTNFINRIYGTARSKTLHGTNEKLLLDWTETREITEILVRYCLVACMKMAQDNWYDKDTAFLLSDPVVS